MNCGYAHVGIDQKKHQRESHSDAGVVDVAVDAILQLSASIEQHLLLQEQSPRALLWSSLERKSI